MRLLCSIAAAILAYLVMSYGDGGIEGWQYKAGGQNGGGKLEENVIISK